MQRRQILSVLFAVLVSAAYSESKFSYISTQQNAGNIIEVAQSLGLSHFVKFSNDTGLTKTLTSQGPFTLFGPSDLAYTTLPANMKFFLQNSSILQGVTAYQVHKGELESKDLKNDMIIPTLVTGFDMRINVYKQSSGKTVITADCRVVSKPDQQASNGLIHVQDGLPFPAPGPILDMIQDEVTFSTFKMMINKAGLQSTFSAPGPITAFLPSEEAFLKIPAIVFHRIINNSTLLKEVILYHVVSGTYCDAGLEDGMELTTLQGDKLHVTTFLGGVKVGKGIRDGISYMDFMFKNGVANIVDNLILPHRV